MHRIIVAGIGTDVGKTVVSAIITKALQADYWKPVQCDIENETDSEKVATLVADSTLIQHPSAYMFPHACSPHYAAELQHTQIEAEKVILPTHQKPLIIESAGGLCVPLTDDLLQIDLFASWNPIWVVVSKHYLGSINHSLMTFEALKSRKQRVAGLIFNGAVNEATERVILKKAQVPMLGRLYPEDSINSAVVHAYANSWKESLKCLIA